MISRKQKHTPSTLSRVVIAGSCSALLLLGATGAIAEHHEVGEASKMTNAKESVSQAKESISEAKEDVAEAREDVSEASQDVAEAKEDADREREALAKAQDQHQQAMAADMPTVAHTAKSIIGKQIKNSGGEAIGEISDIGIDWQNAKTPFIVVSAGGVLGVGGDQYKVPLERLTAAADSEYFTMDITEKDLKSEFSKFEPLDERGEE